MKITFHFLVEDKLFEAFKIILFRTLDVILEQKSGLSRPSIRIRRVPQGSMVNPSKIEGILESMSNYDKLFIVRDSECKTYSDTKEFMQEALSSLITSAPERLFICIVTHAIESWMLYDSELLKAIFRERSYRPPSTLEDASSEDLCHPKRFIREEFRKFGKDFKMRSQGVRISTDLDLNSLNRSLSYSEFKKQLIVALQGISDQ